MASSGWGALGAQWWVACEAAAVARRPLARTVLGTPLVLFRTASGAAAALVDSCPHRGVPLSSGRCKGDGTLACAYHGWTFDGAGRCVNVPGLPPESTSRGTDAVAWQTLELDGLVWVRAPGAAGDARPFPVVHARDDAAVTFRLETCLEGSLEAVIENILDVPHTAFVHAGLFRQAGRRSPVEVVVRRGPQSVEAEFLGEPPPSGLVGRVLAPGGGTVRHVDRFTLPAVCEVDYALGARSIRSTHLLTPETETRTRLVVTVSIRPLLLGLVLAPFLRPFARRILAQDARVLALQSRGLATVPEHRHASTDLDALGAHVAQLLRQARDGDRPPGAPAQGRRFRVLT